MQLYQKETPTQVFYCEYCNFLRTPALKKICERLFLRVSRSDYLSANTSERLFKSNFVQFNHFNCFL